MMWGAPQPAQQMQGDMMMPNQPAVALTQAAAQSGNAMGGGHPCLPGQMALGAHAANLCSMPQHPGMMFPPHMMMMQQPQHTVYFQTEKHLVAQPPPPPVAAQPTQGGATSAWAAAC